jgi:putative PEP-CTERM system TPR-repeat lipoprotein
MLKASIYNRKMNTAKSEATLVEGCKINPENISLKKVLARHYKLEKNINKLTGVMSDIILIEPENDAHRFALASIYLDKNSKDTDKAKSILKSIITQTGDKKITETNYILLAEFYSRHGEKKLCEETLKTGLTCFDKNVDIIIALSSFYYQNNRGKEGYDLMKNSLSFTKDASDPGLLKLKNKLAEIHLRQNEKDEAALYVSEVLAMSPKNVDALFSQSILQMDAGSYEDAITNLRTVVSEAPGFVNAHLNLAKSYILNNQNELAYDTLKKGVNLIPDSRQLAMVLIKYHQKNNDPESAEKEFVSLVNRFPEDLEILAAFGDFYVSEKNYDKAEKQYGIIKTLAKEQPLGYLKSAQLSIFEKKPEKALKELTTALTFNADNPNILQPMIKLLTAHQHFQKAIELCNTQINKNNNAALFYNLSGRILATEKKYDQAVTALSKAFELKPEWKEPYMNLAHVYILQGREQAAINHFETIIHNTPENTHAGLVLASLYEKKHRYKDAIHLYTSLINKMPDNLEIANNLAFLLGEYPDNSSDYSKALFYALKVVEKKPDDLAALDTLGWLHYKSGNLDRAFDILTKILIKKPESPVINYHLGMVFLKQEKLQQAKSALEKAVSPGLKFHGLDEAQSSLERLKTILES